MNRCHRRVRLRFGCRAIGDGMAGLMYGCRADGNRYGRAMCMYSQSGARGRAAGNYIRDGARTMAIVIVIAAAKVIALRVTAGKANADACTP